MSNSIHFDSLCEKLENKLGVSTFVGRDGRTIGRAEGGLVVLFAEPEKVPPNALVYCVDYVKRQSQQGKEYIKCFKFVVSTEFDDLKSKCEEYIKSKEINEILSHFPKHVNIVTELITKGMIDVSRLPEDIVVVRFTPANQLKDVGITIHTTLGDYNYGWHRDNARMFINPRYILINVDDLDVMKISELASIMKGFTIQIDGKMHLVLVRNEANERIAKALEKLNNYDLPYDIKRRILEQFVERVKVVIHGKNEGR